MCDVTVIFPPFEERFHPLKNNLVPSLIEQFNLTIWKFGLINFDQCRTDPTEKSFQTRRCSNSRTQPAHSHRMCVLSDELRDQA